MQETYLEEYFEPIKPFTFRSEFVPLSKDAAKSIVESYKNASKVHGKRYTEWTKDPNLQVRISISFDFLMLRFSSKILAKAIDKAKQKMGCDYIFVRLSSRSPKDSALQVPNFKDLFQKGIKNFKKIPKIPNKNILKNKIKN